MQAQMQVRSASWPLPCSTYLKVDCKRRRLCTTSAGNQGIASGRGSAPDAFVDYLLASQKQIIKETEDLAGDGSTFLIDKWERDAADPSAGYGITSVMEGGDLLEKAAVNISVVGGKLTAERAQAMSSRGRDVDAKGGQAYSAAALSLVFHPRHPFVPTLRADVRRFTVGSSTWFGGGCDLTPAYLFEEDAQDFHAFWKQTCQEYGPDVYSRFKKWCDEYFYLPARKERRGIGGIFFDDVLDKSDSDLQDAEGFVRAVAGGWLPSWKPLVQRRRGMDYEQKHREWQLLRRGRYLEFNLLYDRGVKFGINSRIEAVMVSAPPLISWKYNVRPEALSPEGKLIEVLRTPREWV